MENLLGENFKHLAYSLISFIRAESLRCVRGVSLKSFLLLFWGTKARWMTGDLINFACMHLYLWGCGQCYLHYESNTRIGVLERNASELSCHESYPYQFAYKCLLSVHGRHYWHRTSLVPRPHGGLGMRLVKNLISGLNFIVCFSILL